MALPLESVPNVSEGRVPETIAALREAFAERARVLDVHSDADHNRSVFTLVGDDAALVESLLMGIACARERIDLRHHDGVHPRIGALDVCPLVPVVPGDMERAKAAALVLAARVGELGLPVFLYGELAPGRGPAFFRRGGPDELQRRIDAGELAPDFGPAALDRRAGCVIIGARAPLVAFNVNLRGTLDAAREIAAVVREADGGFPGVRALGLELRSTRLVQVSMNIEEWQAAPLHEIVARIAAEAEARGAEVAGSELVGLVPAGAVVQAAAPALRLAELGPASVLELRLLDTA